MSHIHMVKIKTQKLELVKWKKKTDSTLTLTRVPWSTIGDLDSAMYIHELIISWQPILNFASDSNGSDDGNNEKNMF